MTLSAVKAAIPRVTLFDNRAVMEALEITESSFRIKFNYFRILYDMIL